MRESNNTNVKFIHSYILKKIRYQYAELKDRRDILKTSILSFAPLLGNFGTKIESVQNAISGKVEEMIETIPYISYGKEKQRKDSLEEDIKAFYEMKKQFENEKAEREQVKG